MQLLKKLRYGMQYESDQKFSLNGELDISACHTISERYPTRIRTWTNRVRVCCTTVILSGNESCKAT